MQRPMTPWDAMIGWYNYSVDFAQRSVLFWDTLRQRGNNFVKSTREGLLPVLHFDYEMVLDGRSFERPVNYALVRIVPPRRRDGRSGAAALRHHRSARGPRAGHRRLQGRLAGGRGAARGPSGLFRDFLPEPQPGQTLPDVCAAEQQFVRKVRSLHPNSSKPAIIGNCQGGWAAMMLAAAGPDDTGPIVINGAPMSYWGGAWQEGEGDNPMRYAGGMLGGSWLASFAADMGNGIFDGAYLVENFENLNPANTFWDKYYNLFAKVDTEAPRFLDFERWWGGFYLMNREEIEWITRNLFVGNKLWSGDVKASDGKPFDLRDIKAPIILFASMGDNITPPQQAFNWVADVYGSTEEIKARGQVIVGLVHEDVGHLGIFVSGKVAKKEHAQIVSVLKSVEMLPPGLYAMKIEERKGADGKPEYEVEFHERRLEDIVARINRFERKDEKPFEAVAAVSEFNQRAYELFARPVVQAMSNETTAKLGRDFHPLRFQRWAISDANPVARVARPRSRGRQGAAQGARPRGPAAQGGGRDVRAGERVARSLPRAARCDQRGGFLQHLRQHVLALARAEARSRGARCARRDRLARVALRQGSAGIDSRRRLYARHSRAWRSCWRARTSPCRCRGSSCGRIWPRTMRTCFPRCLPSNGAGSAASRRSSRATSPSRRSMRCRTCWPTARTANACSRSSTGCWPTSACSSRSRPRARWRCSIASVGY